MNGASCCLRNQHLPVTLVMAGGSNCESKKPLCQRAQEDSKRKRPKPSHDPPPELVGPLSWLRSYGCTDLDHLEFRPSSYAGGGLGGFANCAIGAAGCVFLMVVNW
jgi:hypothetical protein